MAFKHPLSTFLLTLSITGFVMTESEAVEKPRAKREAAEAILAASPNSTGVWEANEYGMLVHIPSGFRCRPGREGEILKLIQLTTTGNPVDSEVSCKWDVVRDDGEISVTVTRSTETPLLSELTRRVSEVREKHSATDDGVPMSLGGKPPFALESARLRFLDAQNRQMYVSLWVYSADGWLLTTIAVYPIKDPNAEFMGSILAFGGVADILKIEGPIRLVTEDE